MSDWAVSMHALRAVTIVDLHWVLLLLLVILCVSGGIDGLRVLGLVEMIEVEREDLLDVRKGIAVPGHSAAQVHEWVHRADRAEIHPLENCANSPLNTVQLQREPTPANEHHHREHAPGFDSSAR